MTEKNESQPKPLQMIWGVGCDGFALVFSYDLNKKKLSVARLNNKDEWLASKLARLEENYNSEGVVRIDNLYTNMVAPAILERSSEAAGKT